MSDTMTFNEFCELPDKQMIDHVNIFYLESHQEIHDPDNPGDFEGQAINALLRIGLNLDENGNEIDEIPPSTNWGRVYYLMYAISWAIANRKGVASTFTPYLEYDGLECTQAYATEIFSYLEKFKLETPLPVYREFLDWLEWVEEKMFKQSQEGGRQTYDSTFESIMGWLEDSEAQQ